MKLPSDLDVPIYIKDEFGDFYRDMFRHQVSRQNGKAVFMEYAWNMAWCDPCAADPLSQSELRELGVMWLDEPDVRASDIGVGPQPVDVFVTRLHLRYDAKTFPEDLEFQTTGDRSNFQGRYVLRHAWRGDYGQCAAAGEYANTLVSRWDNEASTLAQLTGWELDDITARMADEGLSAASLGIEEPPKRKWWQNIWSRED
ncbi:MAG: DUF2330 domain-containing protein [Pseudomonadota bacterium]